MTVPSSAGPGADGASPNSSSRGGPTAGYYPDPSIPGFVRYWDGIRWLPGTSRPAPPDGEEPAPPRAAARTAAPSMNFVPPPSPYAPPAEAGPAQAQAPVRVPVEESGPIYLDQATGLTSLGPVEPGPQPQRDQEHGQESRWQVDASQQDGLLESGVVPRWVSWGSPQVQSLELRAEGEGRTGTHGNGRGGPDPLPGRAVVPPSAAEPSPLRAIPPSPPPAVPAIPAAPEPAAITPPAQVRELAPAPAPAPMPAAVPSPTHGGAAPASTAWAAARPAPAAASSETRHAPAGSAAPTQTSTPVRPTAAAPVPASVPAPAPATAVPSPRRVRPVGARPGGPKPAPLGRRLAARVVDLAVVAAAVSVPGTPMVQAVVTHLQHKIDDARQLSGAVTTVWLVDPTVLANAWRLLLVVLAVGLVYEALPVTLWGRTLGKALFGLRVLDRRSKQVPGLAPALSRWLSYQLLLVLLVGVLDTAWCLVDRPWRQCWHDKLSDTFVTAGAPAASGASAQSASSGNN